MRRIRIAVEPGQILHVFQRFLGIFRIASQLVTVMIRRLVRVIEINHVRVQLGRRTEEVLLRSRGLVPNLVIVPPNKRVLVKHADIAPGKIAVLNIRSHLFNAHAASKQGQKVIRVRVIPLTGNAHGKLPLLRVIPRYRVMMPPRLSLPGRIHGFNDADVRQILLRRFQQRIVSSVRVAREAGLRDGVVDFNQGFVR